MDRNILQDPVLTDPDKRNLVKLLIKQLTELKSNYIIRPDKMDAIFEFVGGTEAERRKFEIFYMTLIDRLVGSSSDTNKSIWLDRQILNDKFKNVTYDYRTWVILENTRAFRDGIEKLYIMASEEFCEVSELRISSLKKHYDFQRSCRMFKDFIEKHREELDMYGGEEDLNSESASEIKKRIQRFIKSLPELPTINFMSIAHSYEEDDPNWAHILFQEQRLLDEEAAVEADDNGEERTKIRLKELIDQEFDIYQYGNFYKILRQDGYMTENEVSSEGADMIICCMKVLSLCRETNKEVMDKVQELATLFKVILNADRVQFIIEDKDENNLDEWKINIEDCYNAIVKSVNKQTGKGELSPISIRGNKHYTIIAEKSGFEDYNIELSEETEEMLSNMNREKDTLHNYVIDWRHGKAIWELENNHGSIWINMENSSWCAENEEQKMKIARALRRVMVFYQELKEKIFNAENDDFINEISHIRKELNIYNSNKVYTHTKDYQQEMQFEQMLGYFKGDPEKKRYLHNYPSYVLNLLADINVSKYYRDGLRKKIYKNDRIINEPAVWSDFSVLFGNDKEFVYREYEMEKVSVKLAVSGIDENDAILCRKKGNSVRELMLLIYSLILNAAEQKRGKRQYENSGQTEEQSVIVYLYKEEGCLVIENESEQPICDERINRNRNQVPESEEDGISFWSFNCYIKQGINSLILTKLKEAEISIAEGQFNVEWFQNLGKWIEKLTGEEYEIQSMSTKREGKDYFKVKIPVFMENYNWPAEKEGEF